MWGYLSGEASCPSHKPIPWQVHRSFEYPNSRHFRRVRDVAAKSGASSSEHRPSHPVGFWHWFTLLLPGLISITRSSEAFILILSQLLVWEW